MKCRTCKHKRSTLVMVPMSTKVETAIWCGLTGRDIKKYCNTPAMIDPFCPIEQDMEGER